MAQLNIKNAPDILRIIEVCGLLGVERSTLWRYVKYKKLPMHRPKGANPFFLKSEVLAWLTQNDKV